MNRIQCTVKELFDSISEKENHVFINNEFYKQKTNIKIKNEDNTWININQLIIKENEIIHIGTNDGAVLKASKNHAICTNKKNKKCVLLKNIKIGEYIDTLTEFKKIIFKKILPKETVYDFEVDSETHLYSTANGMIHHNTGKTKTVIEELDSEEIDYVHISGGVKNASSLYKMLYHHNDEKRIIVFDDCNDIFRDKQAVEILRVAVDTAPIRRITYAGQLTTKTDKRIYPDTFEFKSRIIIISNVPVSRIDKAIVSRTSPIEVWVTKEEMLQYIGLHLHAAPPTAIPIEWKHHIYDFLTKELPLSEINRIDFRVFKDACLWYAANIGTPGMNHKSDQWKKFVYTLVH